MTNVTVNIRSFDQFGRKVRKISKGLGDFRPAWTKFFKWYAWYVQKRFDTAGGGRWKPLKPNTVKARTNKWGYYKKKSGEGPTARIGVWTKEMMKIASSKQSRKSYVIIWRRRKQFRLTIKYPKLLGFERGSAYRPKRKVFEKAVIVKYLKKTVKDQIRMALR